MLFGWYISLRKSVESLVAVNVINDLMCNLLFSSCPTTGNTINVLLCIY